MYCMHSDYVQYVQYMFVHAKVHIRAYSVCVCVCVCVCAETGLWRLVRAAAVVETYFNS